MRAALYARVSTEEQSRDGVSLTAQRQALVAYARSQSWEVVDLYVDDGYSGKNLERPAMRRLLADVAGRRVDVVLVWKLDRLSRRQRDVLHLIEDVFAVDGVGFRSVTESFDTTSPAGRAMLGMLSVFAQLEREQIVERTRMGVAQVAREGRHLGGRAPLGYRYDTGTKLLAIDPLSAPCVRLVFDLYVHHGLGYDAIATRLNRDAWPTPHGAPAWRLDGVRDLLRNPVYTGQIRHRGTLHPGLHEPLIDPALWDAAQAVWRRRRDGMRARQTSLLSGLLRCAVCDGRMRRTMVRRPTGRVDHYYACYNRLGRPSHLATRPCEAPYRPAAVVEARVLARIERLAFRPELIDRLIGEAIGAADPDAAQAEIAAIRERRAVLRRQLDRWYAAFGSGELDLPGLREHVGGLQAEDEALAERLGGLETTAAAGQSRAELAAHMRAMVRQAADQLRGATPEEAWAAVHALVREAWVDRASRIIRLDLL